MQEKSKASENQGPIKSSTEVPSMVKSANINITGKITNSDSVVEITPQNSEEQASSTNLIEFDWDQANITKKRDNSLSQSNGTEQSVPIPVQEPIMILETVSSHDKVQDWLTDVCYKTVNPFYCLCFFVKHVLYALYNLSLKLLFVKLPQLLVQYK